MAIINFTVAYDLLASQSDDSDSGVDADIIALIGDVIFTPQFLDSRPVQAQNYLPRPAGFMVRQFTGYISSDGRLRSREGGAYGVRLWANDPVFELENLTYKVEFHVRTPLGEEVRVDGGYFEAPSEDTTVNLAEVLTTTGVASAGIASTLQSVIYAQDIADSGLAGRNVLRAITQSEARLALGPRVFDARDFGVSPSATGPTNVAGLLDVMEQCRAAGGGTIVLPAGTISTTGVDLGTVTAASGRTFTNNGAIPLPTNNIPVTIEGNGVTTVVLSKGFPRFCDMWRSVDGQSYKNITIRGITLDRNNLQGSDLGPTITLAAPLNIPASGYVAVPGNHADWKNAKLALFPEHNFIGFCYVSGTTLYVASVIGAVTISAGEHIKGALHDHIIVGSIFHRGMYAASNAYNMRIDRLTVEDVEVINAYPEASPPAGTPAFSVVPQNATASIAITAQRSLDFSTFVPSVTNVTCRNVRMHGGSSGISIRGENRCYVDEIWLYDCYHDTLVDPLANYYSANYLIGGDAWVGRIGVVRCIGRRSGDVALELDTPWDALEEDCVWEDAFAHSLFRLTVRPPARTAAGPPTTTLTSAITAVATTATVTSMPAGVDASGLAMIDSELIAYQSNGGTSWTIWRGINGTTAAGHAGVGSGVNIIKELGAFEDSGSTEDAHSGTKSWKTTIPNDGAGNQTFEWMMPFAAGTAAGSVYNAELWMKPKSGNAATGGVFYVRAVFTDSTMANPSTTSDFMSINAPTSGGWAKYTGTFTVPAGYNQVLIVLWSYGVTAGNVYYTDDFIVATGASTAGATVTFVQTDRTRIKSIRQTVRASGKNGTIPYAILGYGNTLPHAPLTVRDPTWEYKGGEFRTGFALGAFGWNHEIDISGLRMTHDVSHPGAGESTSVIGTEWRKAWEIASSGAPLPVPVFMGRNNVIRATGSMSNTSIYSVYTPADGSWYRWDFDVSADIDIAGAGAGNIRFWDVKHGGAPNFIAAGSRLGITASTPSGTVAPVVFSLVGAFPDSRYSGNGTRIVDTLDLELDLTKLNYTADATDSNYSPWQIDSTQLGKVRIAKVRHPSTAGKYPNRRASAAIITADYTVGPDDDVIVSNAPSAVTVTLPPVTGGNSAAGLSLVRGRQLLIVDGGGVAGSSSPITITPASGDVIDSGSAGASITINTNNGSRALVASDQLATFGPNLMTEPGWETTGSTEAAHTGSKSYKLNGGTGFFDQVTDIVVTAGEVMYCEMWVRGKTTNTGTGPVYISPVFTSSIGTPSGTTGGGGLTASPPKDATWRKYTGYITVPAGGWNRLKIQVGTYGSPGGDVYYCDDAVVTRVTYRTGWISANSSNDLTLAAADARYQPLAANLTALSTKTAPSGALVGTTDTQTLSGKTLTGTKETVFAITDGAAFEIDPANGGIQTLTLGANRTPKATNFTAGQSVTLMVAATSSTITWTDSTLNPTWVGGSAPALSSTKTTVITLWKVGSTIYGCLVGTA